MSDQDNGPSTTGNNDNNGNNNNRSSSSGGGNKKNFFQIGFFERKASQVDFAPVGTMYQQSPLLFVLQDLSSPTLIYASGNNGTHVLQENEEEEEQKKEIGVEKSAEIKNEKSAEIRVEKSAEIRNEKSVEIGNFESAEIVNEKSVEIGNFESAEIESENSVEIGNEKWDPKDPKTMETFFRHKAKPSLPLKLLTLTNPDRFEYSLFLHSSNKYFTHAIQIPLDFENEGEMPVLLKSGWQEGILSLYMNIDKDLQ